MAALAVGLAVSTAPAHGASAQTGPAACHAAPGGRAAAPDPRNATYDVGGRPVTLASGLASWPAAPGAASQVRTRLVASAVGDLDGDGRPDTAAVLVQNTGGSGDFNYVAALLDRPCRPPLATPAVPLGDRVAIRSIRVADERATVDYLVRRPGQPFADAPTVPVRAAFEIRSGALVPVRS